MRGERLAGGLEVRQTRVPMGVVAMVYEARPNVTVDAAGLALKSGNAVVLRGGSGAAASLFFLSPPVTAVLAWVVLDETLSLLQVVGLVVAVVGVAAATRTRAAPVPQPVGTQ